jgi:hypothetical protein
MRFFTPQQQTDAIGKRVEANVGSILEDLIVGAWLVYGLSYGQPESELHQLASGIINSFELHEFGWSKSHLIPGGMIFEGEDATLEDRITQYCDIARENEHELRQYLVMMVTTVLIQSENNQDSLMRQWAKNTMDRHKMTFDKADYRTPLPNFVLPKKKNIQ